MQLLQRGRRATLICVVLLLVATLACFAYSVKIRAPWFGKSPICPETWLTSGSVLFAKHWYREEPWNLWFGLFWDPASIEFPTLESRSMYTSYPPGAILPIYCVSKLTAHEPSLAMFMAYNLFGHFAMTLMLSLLMFAFLRRMRCSHFDALAMAAIPIPIVLLLPAPAFQLQMAFFHDQSVLIPFILYVMLEFVRDGTPNARTRHLISFAQTVIAFFGILSDWLFAFVALSLYLKRLFTGEIAVCRQGELKDAAVRFVAGSVKFWFSFVFALTLFALQLYHFGRFGALYEKFQERTGMASGKFLTVFKTSHFWRHHMVRGYGETGRTLIYCSMILLAALAAHAVLRFVFRRKPNARMSAGLWLMFLLLAPCVLQVYVLRQHSAHIFHFFSAGKFAIPLATVPLILIPATLLARFNANFATLSIARARALIARRPWDETRARWSILPLLLLCFTVHYVYGMFPHVLEQFLEPPEYDPVEIGAFISENTSYNDVLFTNKGQFVTREAPLLMAYSMKHAYLARSLKDIGEVLAPIEGAYTVDFLMTEDAFPPDSEQLLQLLASASQCERDERQKVLLFKIPKEDCLSLCHKFGNPESKIQNPKSKPPHAPT